MRPPIVITDADDARVGDYRAVSTPALAVERRFIVVEGRFIVQRLLQVPTLRVRSLLLDEASLIALQSALLQLAADVPVYMADRRVLEAITGFDIHRGCLALADRPEGPTIEALAECSGTIVVLEDCNNADNMGGVFRNAAAFAAAGVVLSPGCCDPFYRKSIRTSMGAVLRVPFVRAASWPSVLDMMSATGYQIAALTPWEPAITLEDLAGCMPAERLALLVGAEGDGLSDDALRRADVRVRIPITGAVDSLNLAVATGIALARLSVASRL